MNYSEGSLLEDDSMASLVDSDASDVEELNDTVLSGNISFKPPALLFSPCRPPQLGCMATTLLRRLEVTVGHAERR